MVRFIRYQLFMWPKRRALAVARLWQHVPCARGLLACLFGLSLAACGGSPFALSSALSAGDAGDELAAVLEHDAAPPVTDAHIAACGCDAGDARAVLEHDAGAAVDVLEQLDAGDAAIQVDASWNLLSDAADAAADVAADVVDAGPACDPAYGDASPGGSCCVHVWATPTMGGVLCTVDGARWCWQTGSPCSALGSKCVQQNGVQYCAP